jgi:glycosyltransferase involved in cell wall biosynthesis
VIHNTINEKLFPYVEKDPELRKSILIIRKFDNVSQHAIDLCVFTIHELARRPFFGDLNISIYGDGSFFDELLNPVKQYPNVRLFRTFLPNDGIAAVHAGHGILLLPSRHDAHAVSMSEGASSGLVVVGSDVTSNGDFMNNAANRTMAEPENYMQLADIIERLYRNPAEFSEISRRMSEEIRTRCSTGETAAKEAWIIKKCIDEKHEYIVPAAKDVCKTPVLTLAVPAYNVEKFLDKCLFSLVNRPNVGKTEILVINDGSTDSSLEIAMEYAGRFKGMVRVIDKKNGGHGSAINAAIREARGVYLRLIDGDDWVDSAALAEQVERLESETADIVLTEGMYEYADRADLQPILNYDCLREGTLYDFDDLCWQFYGFFNYGPMLPTATYRTGRLREAQIQISEKMAYVDMEFNALTLLAYRTLRYYNLNVYRYLIGRSGQSVARETWKKKYRDHEKMLLKLVDLAVGEKRLSPRKREYLIKNLIAPVTDTHVFMLDQLCRWDELDEFMKTLKKTPYIHSECIKFINAKNGESKTILARYKFRTNLKMLPFKNEPIIGKTGEAAWRITPAKMIKAMVPYGIIRAYQKGREGSGVSGLAGDFWDRVKAVID